MIKTFEQMIANIPARFEKLHIPEPNSGCWIWLGTVDKAGYGRFTIGRPGTYKMTGAHIISYILAHGKRPPSELDHTCKLRCCVNPAHLEPVTHYENLMRGDGWGAKNKRKTHCDSGHPLSAENTYVWIGTVHGRSVKMRQCRTCGRAKTKAYMQRKKEKPSA